MNRAFLARYLLGQYLQSSNSGRRNRRDFYQGAHGLRMIALHETRGRQHLDRLKLLVEYCMSNFEMGSPDDIVALSEGRYVSGDRDRVIFTFDDGHADNFDAATFLESKGLRAIFFVIPSFLGRTVQEYYRFHEDNGVQANTFAPHHANSRGLSHGQIKEMAAMGHLIAGHNYSHRDLGKLRHEDDIKYEVQRALDGLSNILGRPCQDFAFGFGQAHNLSAEAADYLRQQCQRTYACVRGLNVPGVTPQLLLRDPMNLSYPLNFYGAVLACGLDRRFIDQCRVLENLGGTLPKFARVA